MPFAAIPEYIVCQFSQINRSQYFLRFTILQLGVDIKEKYTK